MASEKPRNLSCHLYEGTWYLTSRISHLLFLSGSRGNFQIKFLLPNYSPLCIIILKQLFLSMGCDNMLKLEKHILNLFLSLYFQPSLYSSPFLQVSLLPIMWKFDFSPFHPPKVASDLVALFCGYFSVLITADFSLAILSMNSSLPGVFSY